MRKQGGFSLAELIIIAAVCAIIAWFAVPAILRARRAVVEAEILRQDVATKQCVPSHLEEDDAWYFPCNDENFPRALDVFKKEHPELRVASIHMQPEDRGATVVTEPVTAH